MKTLYPSEGVGRGVRLRRSRKGAARASSAAESGRVIRAQDFFEDLLTTALQPTEILTSVRVPFDGPRTGSAYAKMQQQASGFAIVGVASLVRLDAAGKAEEVRVGVTGVDSVPYRARAVEESCEAARSAPPRLRPFTPAGHSKRRWTAPATNSRSPRISHGA